jgi:aspartyl-tRNA(Asn)/glutamyl-tRNA(Gln) amidotransferase subunit A
MADLADCTASELLDLYRTKRASPVEAAAAVLERIDRLNPVLNAFCLVDHDAALASARESEARWHRGEPTGVLDGVPTSIKDLFVTRGWPTLRGSRATDPNQLWDTDAPAVARLREAGAVLVGKTCTPEFGCKGETNSPLTGLTRNPWDPSKTPGGSSGGTAAAVAAGMAPLSIGTDGAGSVRIPAAFCGNFGMKPSFGRVPVYPPSPFFPVSHAGPHTMDVRDAALLMNVLKRPDTRDWGSLPPDDTDYTGGLDDGIHGWRVAFSPALGYVPGVDPEVAAAVEAAARYFANDVGAHVERVDPGFDSPLHITIGMWFAGAHALWAQLTERQRAVCDPDFLAEAEQGARVTALELQRLHLERVMLGSHMRQFMQDWDLLITPSVSVPAFDAREAGSVDYDPDAMLGWTPFSYPFNLTGQPAATIPCGLTSAGLPIGLQIVGPMFADAAVLRAARAFESSRPIARPDVVAV